MKLSNLVQIQRVLEILAKSEASNSSKITFLAWFHDRNGFDATGDQLAERTGKLQPNISRDIKELIRFNLIEFVKKEKIGRQFKNCYRIGTAFGLDVVSDISEIQKRPFKHGQYKASYAQQFPELSKRRAFLQACIEQHHISFRPRQKKFLADAIKIEEKIKSKFATNDLKNIDFKISDLSVYLSKLFRWVYEYLYERDIFIDLPNVEILPKPKSKGEIPQAVTPSVEDNRAKIIFLKSLRTNYLPDESEILEQAERAEGLGQPPDPIVQKSLDALYVQWKRTKSLA